MAAINPITHSGVIAIDRNISPEEKLQSLLHVWLRFYFSGNAFTTRDQNGGTRQLTFQECEFLWNEDVMPANPKTPVLHGILLDKHVKRSDSLPGAQGFDERWHLEFLIRVPSNLTSTAMPARYPEHACRTVADQLAWLFQSSEREALLEQGVHELKLERGPAILPANAWQTRLLIASCLTSRTVA